MAESLFDRLGHVFRRPGSASAAPVQAAPAAQAAAAAPAVEASAAAPAAEASAAAPAAEAGAAAQAAAAAPEAVTAGPMQAAAPAAPAKSPQQVEQEQLWGQVDQAWGANDFEKVSGLLDRLKQIDPQENAVIDEKLAAAQYNWAGQVEQSGDLNKALFLYQEAKQRNPNLGEANFAIERVQAKLAPPAAAEDADQVAAAAERTYTVQGDDTLSGIAEKMYGSANDWQKIFAANRDQISNPDVIQPGQTLKIP
jgi:nucleoid-associated protein YgaU